MKRRAGIAVLVLVLSIPVKPAVAASDAAERGPLAGGDEQVLDEVLVQGTQLWRLREKMVQVEDEFYARYNQLSKDRAFHVRCPIEAPPDRIIRERICRVAFHEDAQQVEAQSLLDGHSAPPSAMVAQARQADFEKHFMAVVNADPRLRKLVRERDALDRKYEEERKRRIARRSWFRFEK